jgi:membrane-anchored glycerophosphoryl diester phosphodiesterase (GDPDase)
LVYAWTVLSFAPPLIVLEQLGVGAAIKRSFALVKNDFWRVFGIRFLGVLVAGIIASAVSIPFSLVGEVLLFANASTATVVVALVLITIGGAIGQIITAPFNAGVVVLLYTDRRIRAEAFDLVLQTGVTAPQGSPADSTDRLWLTAPR